MFKSGDALKALLFFAALVAVWSVVCALLLWALTHFQKELDGGMPTHRCRSFPREYRKPD